MRLIVASCGEEIAELHADPAWQLHDLLAALPPQSAAGACRVRVFLGTAELEGDGTLSDLGASDGAAVTIVRNKSDMKTSLPMGTNATVLDSARTVAVRTAPAYPGERTDKVIPPGWVEVVTERCVVEHALEDGSPHQIFFYRLEDGSGWLHDFNDQDPSKRDVQIKTIRTFIMREGMMAAVAPGVGCLEVQTASECPGEATDEVLAAGETFEVAERQCIRHVDRVGGVFFVYSYRLSDGRGWVHDFSTTRPGERTIVAIGGLPDEPEVIQSAADQPSEPTQDDGCEQQSIQA